MDETSYFEVELVRSGAGRHKSQRATLVALGLTRIGRKRYLKDSAPNRGALYKVVHLIKLTPRRGVIPLSARARARAHREGVKHAAT